MAALPIAFPATPLRWPDRTHLDLHDELHARPALAVQRPSVVSYWVHWGMAPASAEAALATACRACGSLEPDAGARHHLLQTEGFALKYERHGEFISWQVNRPLPDPGESCDDGALTRMLREVRALDALPPAFGDALRAEGAGQMLAATHVVLVRCHDEFLLPRSRALMSSELGAEGSAADDSTPLLGAWIADDKAAVLTDLRVHADGFTRLVLLDFGLAADQAAREAQRLCEIEAYRMLAMLGFPVAQREAQSLGALERSLQQTVDAMANDAGHDQQQAFDTLTRLAAEVEHSAARTRYRFSATRAYHQIVQRRLADLRERRLDGVQTLSGFLGRRFAPAMAFCESTDARLTDVADRISRAVGLARVRVEMHRESTNQQVFKALAHRQALQLRLQQTVEGLSVVAISYYLLGLVGYLAKAAKTVPAWEALHLQPDMVVGLSVVPVVLAVTMFMRRLRRHLDTH
jgi:uncharacterized membrane-anchored protein